MCVYTFGTLEAKAAMTGLTVHDGLTHVMDRDWRTGQEREIIFLFSAV